MFLVVLVVFSIVRHTTLSKRQRNSSIERAPMRICIRSRNPRHRTRHHRHHRNSRGRVVVHGTRQTVSGFFEGNVAPPPYSAVLDDNESVRAGDPPPPYRPPSCMALGVIVWSTVIVVAHTTLKIMVLFSIIGNFILESCLETVVVLDLRETHRSSAQHTHRTSQLFKCWIRIQHICFLGIGLQPVTKVLARLPISLPPSPHIYDKSQKGLVTQYSVKL